MASASASKKVLSPQTRETSAGPELGILIFNVSGAGSGQLDAQREAIDFVLNSEELAIDSSSAFLLCMDKVTPAKKNIFFKRLGMKETALNKSDASIFFNKKAETEFSASHYVHLHPLTLRYQKQNEQLQKCLTKCDSLLERLDGVLQDCAEDSSLFRRKLPELEETVRKARDETQHSVSQNITRSQSLMSELNESLQMATNPLNERLSVVVTKAVLNSEQNKKIMLVSWHGPNRITGKDLYFKQLFFLVEDLRHDYCPEAVVVVGGDFNYPASKARTDLSEIHEVEVLASKEKIIYAIVWPKGHLKLLPGFPKTLPASAVSTGNRKKPFDHNITLYRFGVVFPEKSPEENPGGDEDEGDRRTATGGQQMGDRTTKGRRGRAVGGGW